ncbi:hypothetical protein T440DRAFT_483486 [Plenodomus tracheiphilus IPT5]|uniref:Uncharacterized protein n=1 Tax=Plenodomus tracheiphilus IPT5 TaxID=1408161 RepID=A0A6A7APU4_9PLEO|nr:hypothetical protein T440DRAFT_483486 [Plenodomus tracheiphilus IPT5]
MDAPNDTHAVVHALLILLVYGLISTFRTYRRIDKVSKELSGLQQRLGAYEGVVKSMVERLNHFKRINTTAILKVESMLEWSRDQNEQLQRQTKNLDEKMGDLVTSVRDMHMRLVELSLDLRKNQKEDKGSQNNGTIPAVQKAFTDLITLNHDDRDGSEDHRSESADDRFISDYAQVDTTSAPASGFRPGTSWNDFLAQLTSTEASSSCFADSTAEVGNARHC